jgi:undecaprenyl-diphosphatase
VSTRAATHVRRFEQRLCERLSINRTALALVGLAVSVVAAASTALAAVGEDVLGRNGLETRDASNLHFVTSNRTGWLISVARDASQIGSVGLLIALAAAAAYVFWRRGAHLGVALTPLISLLVAGSAAALVKQLVGRGRPPLSLRLVTETGPSFPSGHATDSAALFVALGIIVAAVLLRRPPARALCVLAGFACAALIGLSRLMLGVHWPTDVLAGWAVGTIVAVSLSVTMLLLVRANPTTGASRGRLGQVYRRTRTLLVATRPKASIA